MSSLRRKALRQFRPWARRLPWSFQRRIGSLNRPSSPVPDRMPAEVGRFLAASAPDLRGALLVAGDLRVMSKIRFQSAKVVDVVDKDPFNLDATVIADLCEEGSIPESRYDCCIFSGVAPPCGDRGLGNLWRALAPGGVMLLAIDRRELPESGLDRIFPAGKAQVVAARGDYLLARVFKRGT